MHCGQDTSYPVAPAGSCWARRAGAEAAEVVRCWAGNERDVEVPGGRVGPVAGDRANATVRFMALGLAPMVTWAEKVPALARRGRVVRVDDGERLLRQQHELAGPGVLHRPAHEHLAAVRPQGARRGPAVRTLGTNNGSRTRRRARWRCRSRCGR